MEFLRDVLNVPQHRGEHDRPSSLSLSPFVFVLSLFFLSVPPLFSTFEKLLSSLFLLSLPLPPPSLYL